MAAIEINADYYGIKGIKLKSSRQRTMMRLETTSHLGNYRVFEVKPTEKIMGVYGTLDKSSSKILSLGFMVWLSLIHI